MLLFKKSALKLQIFDIFVKIFNKEYKTKFDEEIGDILNDTLNLGWKPSTRDYEIKILINWARYLDLIPKKFNIGRKQKLQKQRIAKSNRELW